MKTILLVFALIQVSVGLKCVIALQGSSHLNGSEELYTCPCGNFCASYYFPSDSKYAWSCGCLIDRETKERMNICKHKGINTSASIRVHCCSGDKCNNQDQTSNNENPLMRSLVKAVEHLTK